MPRFPACAAGTASVALERRNTNRITVPHEPRPFPLQDKCRFSRERESTTTPPFSLSRGFAISCLPRQVASSEQRTMPVTTRSASSTLWPVGQAVVAPPSGGHLEPTTRPAEEPGFHWQADHHCNESDSTSVCT